MTPPPDSTSESPDPETMTPATKVTTGVPGFLPLPERSPDPLAPDAILETSPWIDPEDDDDRGEEASPKSSGPKSSPASTVDPALLAGEVVKPLIFMASAIIRLVRRRRRPNIGPEVWLADEQDQSAIGDPLARMAARRIPDEVGPATDAMDIFGVGIGVAGYTLKNLADEDEPWTQPITDDEPVQ